MVSILFKPGPRPQTRRKPFITPCREGNVGKNQSDHVAPSLAAETWTASSLPLQSPHPGYAHWLTQTASTPRYPSSFSCHSLGLFLGEEVGVETKPRVQVTSPSKDRLQLNFREIQKKKKKHPHQPSRRAPGLVLRSGFVKNPGQSSNPQICTIRRVDVLHNHSVTVTT